MQRVVGSVLAAGLLVGCSGAVGSDAAPDVSPTQAAPSLAAAAEASGTQAEIVGVWRGEHDCDGIAGALADAGFDDALIIENVVGNGLIPGVTSPADIPDVAELCADATVLDHSHEFTADGQFFSYDQDGNQVDFGTYQLADDADIVAIGAPDRELTQFDFTIEGDHLTLDPRIRAGCLRFECAWALMVAMSWSGMDRVE